MFFAGVTDAFNGYSQEEVLACAAGMEAFSKHPVAQSITEKAQELKLDMHSFENFQSVMGKGVRGDCLVCTDKHHCLGNRTFVGEEHEMAQEVLQKVDEFEAQGKTTIVMSTHGKIKGVIGVTDALRPESAQAIAALKKANIHSVMLTGDNRSSAQYVAKALGIDDVRAELLPEAKVEAMRNMEKQYGDVAMIGDGVNDAAALATATVGIAMGAVGSDIAMENADIALMTTNLNLLPFLIRLGQKCDQKIRFNVAAAILIKLLFIGLALSGHSNLALAIFADVGVTVLVILNSLRLYNYV
jgi:Cd2+/Zn2+-exporting ATPase